jgi:hypothetical protein
MLSRRTLLFLVYLVGAYVLLWLPAALWPGYLDSPAGLIAAIPYLSIYLFHSIGVPGLLEHNGACGWGWCAPTRFGWAFLVLVWLLAAWLVAWLLAATLPGGASSKTG